MIEKKVKLFVLISVALMDFLLYTSMYAIPPVLQYMINEYAISYTTASSLMYLLFIPQILFSVYASKLISLFNAKRIAIFGSILMTIGNFIVALNQNFELIQLGRFVVGVGIAFAFIATLSIISTYFEVKERGKPMGIVTLTYALAIIFSFNVFGGIARFFLYTVSMWVMFLISLIITILFTVISTRFSAIENINGPVSLRKGIKNKQMLLVATIWLFLNMGIGAYITWIKIYLVNVKGIELQLADFLASMIMIFGFFRPLAGMLSDKVGRRKIFITTTTFGFALGTFLLSFVTSILIYIDIIFLGLCSTFLAPVFFTLPGEIMKDDVDVGYGVLNTGANIGYILGPFITAFIFDVFGLFEGFIVLGMFYVFAFILSLFIKVR